MPKLDYGMCCSFLKLVLFVILLLFGVIILHHLTGCSSIENIRDKDFNIGCAVVEGQLKLGYFSQEGAAEVCKLKCSAKLPEDLVYSYHNSRTGCRVSIRD